jgi:outer membrane protein assembly factor BamD
MFNKSFIVISLISLCLFITSCSSKNKDLVPDKSPDELYISAYDALSKEDYTLAKEYLEAIDSRYPFGPYAHQVQLNLIYTYYKERENDLALAEIDKFIRLNPSDEHIDYLLYIRGLTNIQKSTDRMLDLIRIDRYDRDTSYMEQAYGDFNKLCNMYPKSLFIADAISRMIHIRNMLAKHELAVAKYYYKRQAYISTARRCQKILQLYKDSEQLEEALHLLADSYEHLNLIEPAQKTRQLINLNFN